ncbi:MAG: hypothetical protein HPY54_06785 [Chthonomonadetes bacterium]|nr:hypothetical protein [Chthonomonadetes bacterium]
MSARLGIACILWSIALIVSSWAQTLTVDVTPGFDGTCPAEGCFPVTVYIQGERANAPPVAGEVEVVANSWAGKGVASRSVTLGGGLVSQAVSVLMCVPGEPYELTARLIVRGRVLATSKPVSVNMAMYFPLLVGLGTESSALAHLPQRSLNVVSVDGKLVSVEQLPGGYEPPPVSPFWSPGAANRRLFIGRVRNSLPPDSALAYRGVAAVSLDDRAWDTLTERQQNALTGYVLSGGLLVVHGVDINRLQTLFPSGLLPAEPLGLSRVPADALASWIPSLRGSSAEVDVVRSRALGGARVLLKSGDISLVVAMQKGLGQVVFLAFDPGQPPFANSEAAHSLWKALLKLHTNRFVPPTSLFPDEQIGMWSPVQSSRDYYSSIVRALVEAVASRPVPLGWLVTYLGVYILILIPLNYLVLRKMDRLQWSWFTLPVLAVLASAGGYVMAAQVQTSSHQLRWWTALYTQSGSPLATVESDWVLYSAHTQRYRLQARVNGTIIENSPRDLQAERAAAIPQDEPADLRDVPIPLWSARSFHLSGLASLQGTVSVSAQRRGNQLQVTVRNGTPYSLKNLRVVTSWGSIPTREACPPGASRRFRVSLLGLERLPSLPDYTGYYRYPYAPQTPSERPDRDWREQAMGWWLGLLHLRLNPSLATNAPYSYPPGVRQSRPPARSNHAEIRTAVLAAEIEGFPQPAEVTPLPYSSAQQVTMLAVAFDIQGGAK